MFNVRCENSNLKNENVMGWLSLWGKFYGSVAFRLQHGCCWVCLTRCTVRRWSRRLSLRLWRRGCPRLEKKRALCAEKSCGWRSRHRGSNAMGLTPLGRCCAICPRRIPGCLGHFRNWGDSTHARSVGENYKGISSTFLQKEAMKRPCENRGT